MLKYFHLEKMDKVIQPLILTLPDYLQIHSHL